MEQDQQRKADSQPLLATWIKWTMDYWDSLAHMGPGHAAALSEDAAAPGEMVSWQPVIQMWEAFFSLLSQPQTVNALFQGIQPPSEIVLQLAQTGWGAYFHLHRQWLEYLVHGEPDAEDFSFDHLDQEVFKAWAETHERDFQVFLKSFQTGLTPFSQEKKNRLLVRFNQRRAAMGEFISLFHLPIKESLLAMRDRLAGLSHEGKLSEEDFKEHYRVWVKTLEGFYMTLFKSPEYQKAMNHVLMTLEDFTLAKQDLVADALKDLPIPTLQEMDEIYREIYLLKKQVKALTKQLADGRTVRED
jgi:hypothetical protein